MALRESPGKMGLEDDWEEVTDNYSVVSLPTSDDGSTELSDPDRRPSCSSNAQSYSSGQPPQSHDDPSFDQGLSMDLSGSKETNMSSHKTTFNRQPCLESRNSLDSFEQVSFAGELGHEMAMEMGPSDTVSGNVERSNKRHIQPGYPGSSPVQIPDRNLSIHNTLGPSWCRDQEPTSGQPLPDLAGQRRSLTLATEDGLIGVDLKAKTSYMASYTEEATCSTPRRGTIGESLDIEECSRNPVFINNSLQTLEQALKETSDFTAKSRTNHNDATRIYTECQNLTFQVNELLPILAEYAGQWERPSTAARDIPLDPSLQLWIASLSRILSELGMAIKTLDSASNDSKDFEHKDHFTDYIDALSDHHIQMNDFLPIIQIDFNDYKTKHMSFPSPTISERTISPRRNYQAQNTGLGQISCIRHAVYALKDELQRTILILEASLDWVYDIRLIAVTDVITLLKRVFSAVSQALTNNGSEWIESDLKRGNRHLLSYAEFSNLDPLTMEDFTGRIKEINDLVYIDAAETGQWPNHMVREHHICLLFEQQQLDSIEAIVSVLEEIMLPNQVNTRTELDDFLKEV